jgi:hypothetical protein
MSRRKPSGKSSRAATALPCVSDQLETAHRRVLAYLKALHIPVQKRYELAAQSLAEAEKSCAHDGGDCVAAAMGSLENLLRAYSPDICLSELGDLQAMPPLNRGSMIPVVIDRSGPFTFFFLLFTKTAVRLLTPPVRLYVLLVLLLAAAGLYWRYYIGQ